MVVGLVEYVSANLVHKLDGIILRLVGADTE
jgi:hypothetical protein